MTLDPATVEQYERTTWGRIQDGDSVMIPGSDGALMACAVARKGELYAITMPDGTWSPPGAVPPEMLALRVVRGPVSYVISTFQDKGMELENV